jgi:hypothetical protein
MKRYSIGSRVAQSWLVGQSKFFLDLSGHLDSDGLYRESESFLNYGVDLSGLLRYSAVDDVKDLGDDVDSPDNDIVHVEDVNPNAIYDKNKYYHDEYIPTRFDTRGIIHRGNVLDSNPVINNVRACMSLLSVGGGDVFRCLKNLSDNLGSVTESVLSGELSDEDIKYALYNYFKNPLFLEDVLEVNNIVRDIRDGVVNRDTVALFSKVIDLFSGRVEKFNNRREYLKNFVAEQIPELKDDVELLNTLLKKDVENIEVYLEPYVESAKLLKSVGGNSKEISTILNLYKSLNFKKDAKEILFLFRSTGEVDVHMLPRINLVPEALWANFIGKSDYFSNTDLVLYKNLMPDLLEHIIKNINSQRNVKFGENSYHKDSIYPIYKLCGAKGLFDLNYQKEIINNDPKMPEVYQNYIKNGESSDNQFYNKEELDKIYLERTLLSGYNSKIQEELGDAYEERDSNKYILDYLPYYKKFKKYLNWDNGILIHHINNLAPILGSKILDLEYRTLSNLYNMSNSLDKEFVSQPEINNVELIKIYNDCPFLRDIKFKDLLEFNHQRNPKFSSDINELKNILGFREALEFNGKILYLFGQNVDDKIANRVKQIENRLLNSQTKEYFKRLVSSDDFIGNMDFLLERPEIDLNRYTPTEVSAFGWSFNDKDRDRVATIRKSISRSKNYSGIVWGSPEYNKIFLMIAKEWESRGRDPKVMVDLFDAALYEQDDDVSLICGIVNIASGVNNFESIKNQNNIYTFRAIKKNMFDEVDTLYRRYDLLFKDLSVIKEQIINIGGFNVLFSEDPDVLVGALRIREDKVQAFKDGLSGAKLIKGAYFDSVLRVDFNILKNKLAAYAISKFLERYPEAKEKIENGDKIANIPNFKFDDILKWIGESLLNDSDNFIPIVYGIKLNFNNKITLPPTNYNTTVESFNENLKNAGKIIALFGNDTYRVLDKYAFKVCQSKGLPTKGFRNIPHLGLKATIIHDLGNLLPTKTPTKNDGLSDYYINYLGFDDKNLKFVADAWDNEISIVDNDMNFLESGFVKEFAKENDPTKLSKLIKRSNAKVLFENLQPKSTKFALDFIDNFDVPNVKMDDSSPKKILYRGCEDIYLRGLEVPMPSWSDFVSKEGDMTLRFLPREDPRGLMLGKITECCQHPESYAASCAFDGHLNPLAAFAVFEINNEIIYQSYVWSDKDGNVCFDSSEASKKAYKADYDKINNAKTLLIDFSKSIEGECNIGNNFLGFNNNTEALKNPTETYKDEEVNNLLVRFSPSRGEFYRSDSTRQYKVG